MATDEAFIVPHGVVKFRTLKIRGIEIDMTTVISIDIFEGIGNLGITGKIILQEFSGLKEVGNIFAGDSIKLEFGRIDDTPLTLEYVIFESYGDTSEETQFHNIVSFGFCSPWLLNAATKKRSKPFLNHRIDEIVLDIVENCGGKMNVVIPTLQTLERFISPYWTPLTTLHHLMSFAVSRTDGVGGYCLWTDIATDQVNFVPIADLMAGLYGQVGFEMRQNLNHARSPARIIQQKIDKTFDVMKYADSGAGRSQLIGFNYDNTEIMKMDERIDEYTKDTKISLGKQIPLNDRYMGRQYRNTKSSFLFNNTNSLIEDSKDGIKLTQELVKGRLRTKYSMTMADILTMRISSPGEGFQKRVGRTVKAIYPSVEDGGSGTNVHYSGTYLINEIRHIIQGTQYLNVVSLISNAYKEIDRPDMIDLTGEKVIGDTNSEGLDTNFLSKEAQGDKYDSDLTPEEAAEEENKTATEEDIIQDNSELQKEQTFLTDSQPTGSAAQTASEFLIEHLSPEPPT